MKRLVTILATAVLVSLFPRMAQADNTVTSAHTIPSGTLLPGSETSRRRLPLP